MFACIGRIVMKSLPLSYALDPIIRSFRKLDIHFGVPYFPKVFLKLAWLVEQRVAFLMKGTKEAILHDGWSLNSVHYLSVFASFMSSVKVMRSGVLRTEEEWCMPYLTVSTQPKEICDDETSEQEA